MILADLALFFLTSLAVTCWAGYVPARLLLRGDLTPLRTPLMAPLGLATIVVLSSWLNSTVLPMREATAAILALASAVNAGLWLRTRRLGLQFGRREGLLFGLMLLTYGLGVAPLVHAGNTAFVGMQWDLEIYLPLTEYLKEHALWGPVNAPANPLLEQVNGPAVRGGSGLGFSYFEALAGSLMGWESFQTFRPALQFVFSLVPLSVFVFCRGGLRMGAVASLVAGALAGVSGLNLWIASMGLAGHAVALVLLPLALAGTRWVTLEPGLRAGVLTGLVLSGMLLSFYTGALVVYAPAAGVLAVVCLASPPGHMQCARARKRTFWALVGTGVTVLGLAFWGHLRFLELVPLYAQLGFSGGWNVPEFSSLGEALGLIPYKLTADRLGEGLYWGILQADVVALCASGLAATTLALCVVAVFHPGWDRRLFVCSLGAAVVFGLYLRIAAPYPYGFFKLLSLNGFVLVAGLVQGTVALWAWRARRHPEAGGKPIDVRSFWESVSVIGRPTTEGRGNLGSGRPAPRQIATSPTPPHPPLRLLAMTLRAATSNPWPILRDKPPRHVAAAVLAGFWALFLPLALVNTGVSLRYFWEPDPQELPRAVWELDALRVAVPPGERVYLPAQEGVDRSLVAMVAYFLRGNPLVGHLRSQYGRLPAAAPDAGFEYVALVGDRRAWELGLKAEDRVWSNDVLTVYRRPQSWLASVDLASTGDAMRLERNQGLTVDLGGEEWTINNGSERLRGSYRMQGAGNGQQADLLVAAFGQPEVVLRGAGVDERRRLPAGFVSFRTPGLAAPASIQLSASDGKPAWLMGMRVLAGQGNAETRRGEHLLLVQPSTRVDGSVAELSLDYLFEDGRGGYATAAVELYRRTRSGNRESQATAFWRMGDLRGVTEGEARLAIDFASGRCGASRGALRPIELDLAPGVYEAQLAFYYVNEEVVRWPWLEVEMGRTTTVREVPHPPYGVVTLDVPRDVKRLRETLPESSTVYAPPGPHPDYSFMAVAMGALRERGVIGPAGSGPAGKGETPRFALLPAGQDPEAYGVSGAERVWRNGEAGLYRMPAGAVPEPKAGPGEALLQGLVSMTDRGVTVGLPDTRLFDRETIVGVDIYGERPCGLEHYGYWAAPVASLGPDARLVMDLGQQRGTVEGADQTFTQTWEPSDGRYRAFFFTKLGEHFETAALFDFVWGEWKVGEVTPFPVARLRVGEP